MAERIKGTMEQVGVQLAETYEVRIDPSHEEEWNKDPYGFMRRFLEEQGHEVNRVQIIREDEPDNPGPGRMAGGAPRLPNTTFHIVYPANESSGHICCCA